MIVEGPVSVRSASLSLEVELVLMLETPSGMAQVALGGQIPLGMHTSVGIITSVGIQTSGSLLVSLVLETTESSDIFLLRRLGRRERA